jgi:CubicO group peptidase (beta-lactamase class C family)
MIILLYLNFRNLEINTIMKKNFILLSIISIIFLTIPFGVQSKEINKIINENYKAYSDSLENNITTFTYLDDDGRYKTYLLSSKQEKVKVPIFQIGSVSKLFVAHALAKLATESDLGLDTELSEILKGVQYKDEKISAITLKQLANHTSGLPRLPINIFVGMADTLQPYAKYTTAMLYQFLGTYELTREAGKSYEYSNLGYGVLGLALDTYLRKNKNTSLESYIEDEILKPIGMDDTHLELPKEKQARLTQPYRENNPVPNWEFDVLKWAGAYYSTTEDLAKYLNQYVSDTPVVKEEVTGIMTSETHIVNERMKMALGWHITPLKDKQVYWHNGNTYGNAAFIAFVDGKFVAVLSNSNRVLDMMSVDVLSNMIKK